MWDNYYIKMETLNNRTLYEKNVQDRSIIRFYLGYFARLKQFFKHEKARKIARKNGASIGENVILPISLAKRANENFIVGDNTSIQTEKIDLRSPVKIGSNVIIGYGTEIITTSHNIDSIEWEHKYYGIVIEDYVWLPTNILVLPSCQKIEYGAVVGSGSVVVKNIERMSIVSGNPAKEFKKRKEVHSALVVPSLLSGDLKSYVKTWKKRLK